MQSVPMIVINLHIFRRTFSVISVLLLPTSVSISSNEKVLTRYEVKNLVKYEAFYSETKGSALSSETGEHM